MDDLTSALVATGATIAFDAIGGGRQAGQILTCMEAAANTTATEYSRYGSSVHKQVYIYGSLDRGPTEFNRSFGLAWGIGGWLLTPFLGKIGIEGMQRLQARVVAELTTTFACRRTEPRRNLDLRPSGDGPEVPHPAFAAVAAYTSRSNATSARWWMSSRLVQRTMPMNGICGSRP